MSIHTQVSMPSGACLYADGYSTSWNGRDLILTNARPPRVTIHAETPTRGVVAVKSTDTRPGVVKPIIVHAVQADVYAKLGPTKENFTAVLSLPDPLQPTQQAIVPGQWVEFHFTMVEGETYSAVAQFRLP